MPRIKHDHRSPDAFAVDLSSLDRGVDSHLAGLFIKIAVSFSGILPSRMHVPFCIKAVIIVSYSGKSFFHPAILIIPAFS